MHTTEIPSVQHDHVISMQYGDHRGIGLGIVTLIAVDTAMNGFVQIVAKRTRCESPVSLDDDPIVPVPSRDPFADTLSPKDDRIVPLPPFRTTGPLGIDIVRDVERHPLQYDRIVPVERSVVEQPLMTGPRIGIDIRISRRYEGDIALYDHDPIIVVSPQDPAVGDRIAYRDRVVSPLGHIIRIGIGINIVKYRITHCDPIITPKTENPRKTTLICFETVVAVSERISRRQMIEPENRRSIDPVGDDMIRSSASADPSVHRSRTDDRIVRIASRGRNAVSPSRIAQNKKQRNENDSESPYRPHTFIVTRFTAML